MLAKTIVREIKCLQSAVRVAQRWSICKASIIGKKNTEAEEEEEEPTTNRCGVQRKHVGTLYALE